MTDSPPDKPAPPTRLSTLNLRDARTIGEALQTQQFQRAVADAAPAQMTAQRLMATFRQAARNNPAFEQCNLMSVLGVFMTCTFLGLEPNTPQGHAYMIPFAKKKYDKVARKLVDDGYDLQLVIGYQGYLDLAYRHPRVQSVAAHAVYEGDDFSFEYGSNEHLQHRPKGLQAEDDLPRYFYMFAKLQNGQSFEVLPTSRVIRIRNSSQGYRAALASKEKAEKEGWKTPAAWTEAPWVKHFTAMGQKTAMRAGYKWLPKTVEMAAVERVEEAQDRGLIDFGPVLEGHINPLEEDLPMLRQDAEDPGAAFGQRSQDDDPPPPAQQGAGQRLDPNAYPGQDGRSTPQATAGAAQRRPAPTTPATAPTATQPAPTPPREPAPPVQQAAADEGGGFDAYIADAAGELATTVGRGGHFTDPLAFATAYAEIWRATPHDQRDALAEHNADAVSDAFNASAAAADVLNGLGDEPTTAPAPATDPTPRPIQVMTIEGKPDLRGYIASLKASADAQTVDTIRAWSDVQRAVITGLSQVTRRNAEKVVADRMTALGAEKPPAAQQLSDPTGQLKSAASTQQEPPDDGIPPPTGDDQPGDGNALLGGEVLQPAPWGRIAQDMVDQINACKDAHALTALGQNVAVVASLRKLGETDPAEHKKLLDYAAARRADLNKKG